MKPRDLLLLVALLALGLVSGVCHFSLPSPSTADAARIRSGAARPPSGEWVWSKQDPAADLPTEDHRDLVVNKARPVTLRKVCCYADAPGTVGALVHRQTSVGQATAALPTPGACATPGWDGEDGCTTANVGVATNDGIDWNYTTQAGVGAIRVVLQWLVD